MILLKTELVNGSIVQEIDSLRIGERDSVPRCGLSVNNQMIKNYAYSIVAGGCCSVLFAAAGRSYYPSWLIGYEIPILILWWISFVATIIFMLEKKVRRRNRSADVHHTPLMKLIMQKKCVQEKNLQTGGNSAMKQ